MPRTTLRPNSSALRKIEPGADKGGSSAKIEIFRISVDALKAVIWPALIVFAFFSFRAPILAIAEALPAKLSEATKLGVGSLTIEIQQQAEARVGPQFAKQLRNLSPEAIKLLLELGNNTHRLIGDSHQPNRFFIATDEKLKGLVELEKVKLVEYGENIVEFRKWLHGGLFRFEAAGHSDDEIRYFVSVRALTPLEDVRLKAQHFKLTESGRQALQTVLDAVSQQLKSNSSAPAKGDRTRT